MIERDVMESHFDAIEAQLRLSLAQLMAAREHHARLKAQAAPRIAVEMPEKCAQHEARLCMWQDGEPANCGRSVMCRACGDVRDVT